MSLHDVCHQRVEELEAEIKSLKLDNKEMRQCLEWYGHEDTAIRGWTARKCLEKIDKRREENGD